MKTNYINTVSHTVLLFLLFALAGWTRTYAQVGAINGLFTINSDGDQVYFSQGNLQYQASTKTWKFADNQYDYVGADNSNISSTYVGWIDLFGWGTSGYDHGANCYQPWSTSTTNSDYYAYCMDTYNLFDHDGRADWGYNAISNGGNGWRTLTKDEWSYLFNTRTTTSGKLYAKAQVNGVNGVIMLPDDWQASYYSLNSTNSYNANYSTNVISDTEWATLEQHGAVFLPAAGYRGGISVNNVGSLGYYWSASYSSTDNAMNVSFSSSYIYTNYDYRYCGRSVRLVRSVQSCSINATPNSVEGGAVSGAGAYMAGAECTLTATASAGYTFAYWTENGRVVSQDAIYHFIVRNTRVLEANFALSISTGNLNGQFTVGENTVVRFSQGNLQYQASSNTWRFAENQWDYVGADNHQISDTYSGLIDFFGWGTSGYNHGANCYQPWSTSTTSTDYYAYGSDTYNLYDETGQADWGYCAIANGSNQENNGWRTLTQNEWYYLFNTRTTASGMRYAKAKVNGVNGVILLPDDWSSSTYSLNSTNSSNAAYTSNTISSTQWAVLEQHGAVFLPAAGYRKGTSVSNVGSYGCYWSASYSDSDDAYGVYFNDSYLTPHRLNVRYYGRPVRLVRSSQNCSFGINAIPSPPGGGAVSGSGAYEEGAECTLTATPTPGFSFLNWTENGQVVAMFPQYSFTVNESRKLVANFVNSNIITFADANVKALSVANWDTNGDGELSYEEAAAVIVLSSTFQNDTTITTFDELCYFTGLTEICNQAFSGCNSLTSITLPETVTVIGADAFCGCTSLASVHYPGTISQWCALHFVNGMSNPLNYASSFYVDGTPTQNVVIPEEVTNIGNYAFYNYDNLLSISLPNTLTNIGNYAFYDCDGLTSITVSEGVSQIGNDAFTGCDNLAEVHFNATNCASGYLFQNCNNIHTLFIGENVLSLPEYVFYYFNNLQAIHSEASTPPAINYTVFPSGCTGLPLYVPCGAKADYQADPLWGYFNNYIEICSFEIVATVNPAMGGAITGAGTYSEGQTCTLIATPNDGYTFVNWMENGMEVSTNATYTFTVTGNRSLVAIFALQGHTPTGAINGLFSVGENNQVYFSQGNLQYQATTNTWRFAENQYDMVGDDNSNISQTYNGWIDLFGWGTSGWDNGNTFFHPWDFDNANSSLYGPCGSYSLTGEYADADWGVYNAISNGGNQARLWRTLTHAEWDYVFNTRNTSSGIRYAKAQVKGVNGVILFPDNWNSAWYSPNAANNSSASYSNNIMGDTQWSAIETMGAVFLPVAGCRFETSVYNVGSYGNYWSASSFNNDSRLSYSVFFYDGDLSTNLDYNRCCGLAVRLVRTAQASTSYSIEAVPNPFEGGSVTGAGTYANGQTCTLTATPNEGYTFVNWTENGGMVSTDATYTFTVSGDRNLVAAFCETSTYPLLYLFNEDDHTATVTGHWDGQNATGELVIPETVVHNGETYTVTSIDSWSFSSWLYGGCGNLTSVSFPNTLVSIGFAAFESCGGLTSIVIPSSVALIEERAFSECHFVQITVESENAYYDSRNNCNAIIETSTNKLMYGCGNTIIPEGVVTIGGGAFGGYSDLTSITIPSSVSSIEIWAFSGCGLTTMTVLAENPPILDTWNPSFAGVNHDIPVYVPCGSLEAYQNADGWNEFTNIMEMCSNIAVTINPAEGGTVTGAGIYTQGQTCTLTATPNEGYTFVNWTENGEVVSTDATYTFTVTGNRSLVANFSEVVMPITNHWVPYSDPYEDYMSVIAVVQIDGTEQTSTTLELGAFCGDECRGSKLASYFPPTQRYIYQLPVYGNSNDAITFQLFDHNTQTVLDLTPETSLVYVENGYGSLGNPTVLNFLSTVAITAGVTPNGSGTVEGTGDYLPGTEATLTAVPNTGYAFNCWKESGTVVSTDAEYTFTVTGARNLTACFDLVQTTALNNGWNWFSTYIVQSGSTGLEQLETSLGANGQLIKSRTGQMVENYDGSYWWGSLTAIDNRQMYEVKTNQACQVSLQGNLAKGYQYPITLAPGWNWIGYVANAPMDIDEAFSSITPNGDDAMKSRSAFSTYFPNWGWYGGLETLEPGQGYKYNSTGSSNLTLTYPTPSSKAAASTRAMAECHFKADAAEMRYNMCVMASVLLDDIELSGDRYELAAFVGNRCRGSVRLTHVDPMQRDAAFLAILGEGEEVVSFRLYDHVTGNTYLSDDAVTFEADGRLGGQNGLFPVRFSGSALMESRYGVYPNPASRGTQLMVETGGDTQVRVEMVNLLGVTVKTVMTSGIIDCDLTPGVYTVRFVKDNETVNIEKLVIQ